MRGLNFDTMHIPLAAGRNKGTDPRALSAPELLIAKDVQFDEAGGLQTRLPLPAFGGNGTDMFGNAMSAARKVVANGNELLLFTRDALYTWNPSLSSWRSRGTHLAVKTDETPRFVAPGDQHSCDRAELGNSIWYTWEDSGSVYLAAIDKTTGAVLYSPAVFQSGVRPKLVALTTKVLLFFMYQTGGVYELRVYSLDPLTVSSTGPTTLLALGSATPHKYDAVKIAGADSAVYAVTRSVTTSYNVGTVTAGLVTTVATKARTCDGPIAVSCVPTGLQVQIARGNGVNVQGDLITIATLADVYTAQAIGATAGAVALTQIAAAHRSVQDSGAYRCYVFWDHDEATGGTDWSSWSNWVDTNNTLGVAARFVRALGIASRAFDHNGRVFVTGVFAGASSSTTVFGSTQVGGQLQNAYFLYRDDGHLTSKAAMARAGGFCASSGHLPGVQLRPSTTTEYAWAGTERRIVPLGEAHGKARYSYSDRGPRDIVFTFDSDDARRCVRLGNTLYIAGGEIRQYDGSRITEVGFHVYPWLFVLANLGAGNVDIGEHFYRSTLRWENAAGDTDRSTTATTAAITIGGAAARISLVQIPLYITHKTANAPSIEWWRTETAPDGDADYFLVTKKDPASTGNPNRYLANDTTVAQTATVEDSLADASLIESERYPEALAEIENLAPPPASIIAASADRIFLAGVAGDPDRVWYSKLRAEGRVASFHESLTMNVPHQGGSITALAFVNETLVVFRERAIYLLPGDGFANTLEGSNYGPARAVSLDVGARSAESVAVTPEGLIFKSPTKGWHILDRGWNVRYIGDKVSDYDSEAIVSVHVVESKHQIRCLSGSRMLVLDTVAGQWAEWSIASALGAALWRGTYVYIDTTQVYQESSSYSALTYGIDVETAWIKPADLQGFVRITKAMILGEYRSACAVRIRIAYDYNDTYVDDKTWTVSPTTVGGPLQVKHGPKRQQCQALKVRITAVENAASTNPPTGEAIKLTGLALEVGVQRGLNRKLPMAQRQ